MPITAAICDDNETQLSGLRRLLNIWSENKDFVLNIDEYISAESFLFSYPDKPCDLLLLDIEMKEINGMELAKKLRSRGDMLPIIFITGYSEYMNEGYEVEALHYLLKPVDQEKLFKVLDRYVKHRSMKKEILLQCEDEALHVSADEILYLEANGKKTRVKLTDGRQLYCTAGINALKNTLPADFALCHRSFIVNIRYIRSIGREELALDSGDRLPVSRRMYKEVNEKFIEYFTKKG